MTAIEKLKSLFAIEFIVAGALRTAKKNKTWEEWFSAIKEVRTTADIDRVYALTYQLLREYKIDLKKLSREKKLELAEEASLSLVNESLIAASKVADSFSDADITKQVLTSIFASIFPGAEVTYLTPEEFGKSKGKKETKSDPDVASFDFADKVVEPVTYNFLPDTKFTYPDETTDVILSNNFLRYNNTVVNIECINAFNLIEEEGKFGVEFHLDNTKAVFQTKTAIDAKTVFNDITGIFDLK